MGTSYIEIYSVLSHNKCLALTYKDRAVGIEDIIAHEQTIIMQTEALELVTAF